MKLAVLGGGHGGAAACAHLTAAGHTVHWWSRSAATLEPCRAAGGVRYEGVLGEGFAPLPLITDDLARAVAGVELILVVAPGGAHEAIARALRPIARPEVPLLLNPGQSGGALHVGRLLPGAPLAETSTLTYIARKAAPDAVRVSSLVQRVRVAGEAGAVELARCLYPTLQRVENVVATSLCNLNAVLHPPGTLLGAAWIEHTGGEFTFYHDAATPAVARLMEALDRERLAIGRGWGLELPDLLTLFSEVGSTAPLDQLRGSYLEMLLQSAPNRWLKAPDSLAHRYMQEDMAYGLVPFEALAQVAGVAAPLTAALITVAEAATGQDFRAAGRNAARLGIAGRTPREVLGP